MIQMNQKAISDILIKKRVFAYAAEIKNISKACRHFGISRETFYQWKRDYEKEGDKGLLCFTEIKVCRI